MLWFNNGVYNCIHSTSSKAFSVERLQCLGVNLQSFFSSIWRQMDARAFQSPCEQYSCDRFFFTISQNRKSLGTRNQRKEENRIQSEEKQKEARDAYPNLHPPFFPTFSPSFPLFYSTLFPFLSPFFFLSFFPSFLLLSSLTPSFSPFPHPFLSLTLPS